MRKEAAEGETLTLAKDIAAQINGHLNMRQDVLMAMVLTEEGVAATKVVSAPDEVAIFGIAATAEGVVAGAAVATPEGAAAVGAVVTPVEEGEEETSEAAEEEPKEAADS